MHKNLRQGSVLNNSDFILADAVLGLLELRCFTSISGGPSSNYNLIDVFLSGDGYFEFQVRIHMHEVWDRQLLGNCLYGESYHVRVLLVVLETVFYFKGNARGGNEISETR